VNDFAQPQPQPSEPQPSQPQPSQPDPQPGFEPPQQPPTQPPGSGPAPYRARLTIDYPERLERVSTFFRLIWVIPIGLLLGILMSSGDHEVVTEAGRRISSSGGSIMTALTAATALMLVVRQRYPRWWFDFAREMTRFGTRVGAYVMLLTDRYPSTVDEQTVHLELDYPDAERDLNRWMPLVKWFLAIPHYVALFFLWLFAIPMVVIGWFAIMLTGRYPRALFDYVVGVTRWTLRVNAYAFLLVTDRYPPFSLA
jgi:hypothetical protein